MDVSRRKDWLYQRNICTHLNERNNLSDILSCCKSMEGSLLSGLRSKGSILVSPLRPMKKTDDHFCGSFTSILVPIYVS